MTPESTRESVNAEWLVRLRWAAIAGQFLAVLGAWHFLRLDLPMLPIAVALSIEVLFNVVVSARLRHLGQRVGQVHVASQLLGDLFGLTAMLYLTGGPENPFNFLYLVHIALASVVAAPRLAWTAAALSALLFGGLFVESVPLAQRPPEIVVGGDPTPVHAHNPTTQPSSAPHHVPPHLIPADGAEPHTDSAPEAHGIHSGHGGDMMALHLRGMWLAFVVAAGFIVYFVTRIQVALTEQSNALAEERRRSERAERLAALGTLAAGTAHELATPLASIAIAAAELETYAGEATAADLSTIRSQVARCRDILARMSARAGAAAGEGPRQCSLDDLVAEALAGIRGVELSVQDATIRTLVTPVATAIRPLVENALFAAKSRVSLDAFVADGQLVVRVRDDGDDLEPAVLLRIGEPFFTTKPPGEGAGLGVFLSRSIAEELGGTVVHESLEGSGTSAELRIPVEITNG